MNGYQQKWIDVLTRAQVHRWTVKAFNDDIFIEIPDNRDIKQTADNLETVIAELTLDIDLPKQRLKFIVANSRERLNYLFNPDDKDLTTNNPS